MKRLLSLFIILIIVFTNLSFYDPCIKNGERDVNLKLTYKVSVRGYINTLRLKMIIPATIKQKQTVNELSFSIEPDSIYTANSNTYALFKFFDLEKDFKIILKSKLTIYNVINMQADTGQYDLSKYLVAEPNIEVTSDKIISVARELKQNNDIETTMKTFEYVKQHITYQRNKAIGAEKVLESGVGKCMDYSDLFVALLRANKIPAKSMFGIVVAEDAINPLHAWPEAWLRKQGWVRFDPTGGHSDIEPDGKNFKMKISNKYVTLSEGRNDPELRTSLYYYNYYCPAGSSLKVHHSIDISGE